MDSSSFVTQASTPNSFARQWNQKESEWFVSSSQRTQSRYLQPSLLYDEEEADNAHEVVVQDSPELFTQHSDFHLRGAPFNASELDMEDSEGTIALLCCALKMSYNRQRLLGFPELVLLHCIAWCLNISRSNINIRSKKNWSLLPMISESLCPVSPEDDLLKNTFDVWLQVLRYYQNAKLGSESPVVHLFGKLKHVVTLTDQV